MERVRKASVECQVSSIRQTSDRHLVIDQWLSGESWRLVAGGLNH